MERDNDETNEDVDHEECNDDDVYDVIGSDNWSEIVNWAVILRIGVDGDVEKVRPSLKRRHSEQRQHSLGHVVVMEAVVVPLAIPNF